jgi:hypothetical protein
MGKVGKIVSPEQMAIAEKNNIPKTTVYNRVRAGWDVENNVKERGEEGNFIAAGVGKGKKRSFALPTDWDDVLDKEIKASGLIQTEYIEKMILNQLKRSKYKRK